MTQEDVVINIFIAGHLHYYYTSTWNSSMCHDTAIGRAHLKLISKKSSSHGGEAFENL